MSCPCHHLGYFVGIGKWSSSTASAPFVRVLIFALIWGLGTTLVLHTDTIKDCGEKYDFVMISML